MSVTRNRQRVSLHCEALEPREVPAIISVNLVGSTLIATTNNTSTTIEVRQAGGNIQIKDILPVGNSIWAWSATGVALVELRGGTGNDTFTSFHPTMPMRMLGHNGNDTLRGNSAPTTCKGVWTTTRCSGTAATTRSKAITGSTFCGVMMGTT